MSRRASPISAAVAKRSALAGAHALTRNPARSRSRSGRIVRGSVTGTPSHGHGVRERVVTVAQEPVEQDADGEQIGGDVPAVQAGVGRLIRRRARLRVHGSPTREAMLKSSSFAPVRVSTTLSGLMSRWTSPWSCSSASSRASASGQVAVAALSLELLDAGRVRVKGDERVQQVERDVDGLAVAQALLAGGELVERFPVDELGDEVPVAGVGLAGPEDLHHVGVLDLPQGADLAAHGLVPGGVVEELDRALLVLDVVADAVDLREAASPDDLEDLEAAVDDVADRVVGGLVPAEDRTSAGSGSGSAWLRPRR